MKSRIYDSHRWDDFRLNPGRSRPGQDVGLGNRMLGGANSDRGSPPRAAIKDSASTAEAPTLHTHKSCGRPIRPNVMANSIQVQDDNSPCSNQRSRAKSTLCLSSRSRRTATNRQKRSTSALESTETNWANITSSGVLRKSVAGDKPRRTVLMKG